MTPVYLNETWTEELLVLMFKSRTERLQDSLSSAEERLANPTPSVGRGGEYVSNMDMFKTMGITVEKR